MKRRMLVMLLGVGILFTLVFGYKWFVAYKMREYFASMANLVSVSSMVVGTSPWQPQMSAVGSVRAIRGVNVTTQLAGMVQTISFTPGSYVKEGQVLVQLNADTEIAQLHSLQADEQLAQITYDRDKQQFKVNGVSKQQVDNDYGNLKSLQAQVEQQQAVVAKKTVVAPFTGRTGICLVNPGQFLNPGDSVTSLQTMDPIYVDFYMPQQVLAVVRVGMPVTVNSDAYPKTDFKGKITTINPSVDTSTRNVEIEATVSNPQEFLNPGMFATVTIDTGEPQSFLTVPQTAVTFNPYGQIVYVITQSGTDKQGKPILIVNQAFVVTGETRGDQITIIKGLKKGDTIVTSGQLKLKNGDQVTINNSVQPANNINPDLPNDH